MKLQYQVCTLAQAKRLVTLGIDTGSSYFAYQGTVDYEPDLKSDDGKDYPAFTVAELGVIMKGFSMPFYWQVWEEFCFKEKGQPRGYGTEAVARAALLIHLLESNQLIPELVNKRLAE